MNEAITSTSKVWLNFAVKLPTGEEVDSNFGRDPVEFTMGDGSLLPTFEAKLLGMVADSKETFTISADDAFGQPNPDNVHKMPAHQFEDTMALDVGMMVKFADGAKNDQAQITGVVVEMDQDYVTVDFNHPLAGHDIIFEVAIHQVSNTMIPVEAI